MPTPEFNIESHCKSANSKYKLGEILWISTENDQYNILMGIFFCRKSENLLSNFALRFEIHELYSIVILNNSVNVRKVDGVFIFQLMFP